MKKVVQGVLCDTDTANRLGEYQYLSRRDFHYFREELYRTKSGKFFLYGEGGPASPYAKKIGQSEWTGSEKIQLLPPEAARQWAEEHLDGDEYISAFGEPEDDDTQYTVSIDAVTKNRLDKLKMTTGKTLKQLIAIAVLKLEASESDKIDENEAGE